jgi:hypothetical protein
MAILRTNSLKYSVRLRRQENSGSSGRTVMMLDT